jgi:GT2 family glycosyltransferase
MKSAAWPIAIRMVDLGTPLAPLEGLARYARVRVIVSQGRDLIGSVDLETNGADTVAAERLRDVIVRKLGLEVFEGRLTAALLDRLPTVRLTPTDVSIVVPSCDREADLRRCLASLARQRTRHALEIIVVDNRPRAGTARRVALEFTGVRVLDEARPGLSYARNAGIRAATGEIIVATDDDVVAPEGWIERLLEPFVRPEVACVTGNVLPLELETEAQYLFEEYGGLGKGFAYREFDRGWFDGFRSAVPTWVIGATANAAFRAAIFRDPAIGLLDEALGAGTPTGCSEDTDLFYRILQAGRTIVYTPHGFVWHRHRDSIASGREQIFSYSKGHVAYHLTTWTRYGDRRAIVRLLYALPKIYVQRALAGLRGRSDYPLSLILLEIAGNAAGPFALWRARRRVRALAETERLPEHAHVVSVEGSIAEDPAGQPVVAPVPGVARREGRELQPPA